MTRLRLLLPAAALLLVPACSGDGGGDEGAASGEGVTKEQYVEEASAVCQEALTERQALSLPTAPAGFAPFVDDTVGLVRDTAERLRDLETPEADRDEITTRLLEPLDRLVADAEAFAGKVRAAGADQQQLLALLGEVPQPDPDALEFAREYGLDTCAEAARPPGS